MAEQKKTLPRINFKNAPPPYEEDKGEYAYFVDGGGQPCAERIPFRPGEKSFDLINAWWLCEAATLAYCAPDAAEDIFRRKARFEQVEFLGATGGTECFVASKGDFAVVAFRGSELTPRPGRPRDYSEILSDWLRNANIHPEDFAGGGKVHHGFADGVDRLWREKQFDRLIADLPSRRVWFTGHSLGGALATVAAARMLAENGRLDGLYTYGSPRVGDETFATNFDGMMKRKGLTYYRFVNGQDVVTNVPQFSFPPHKIDYKHAGTLKHIERSGEIRDDRTLFDRLKATVRDLLPVDADGHFDPLFINGIPNAIDDHVPTLYSMRIWNALV